MDLLAGEAAVGLRHREEEFGREDEGAAVVVLEDLAPGRLGGADAVDVGGVEEVDPGVEGGAGAGLGLVALHPTGVGQPGAEGDLRDLEVRIAEPAELHGATLPNRVYRQPGVDSRQSGQKETALPLGTTGRVPG